ncbi:MAG: phytase, partial [Methanomicrobiales archaeon]|nr:phytase [Methanomicrobiales archaeon]
MSTIWRLGVLWGLLGVASAFAAPVTVEVQVELTRDGDNYDDPCFWQDPVEPKRFLAFMTSKDDDLIDVWEMPSGVQLAQITGFEGTANNCDVDQVRNLLVTTDPSARQIRVHGIPDFGLRTVIEHERLREPSGVAVGHAGGEIYAFVTDEDSREVHVFRLPGGAYVRSFPYKLEKAEGISADDDQQRVYVSDDKSDSRGTKAFTFDGVEILEFGIDETGSDSEGNAVYRCGPQDGYIIISDQRESGSESAYSEFEVFDRKSFAYLGNFRMRAAGDDWTGSTDGIDVFQGSATEATGGIFAACDGCGQHGQARDELDIVGWDRIAAQLHLRVCPNGAPGMPGNACDRPGEPAVSLSGTFSSDYRNKSLRPNTTIDARAATFFATPDNRYPINLGGGAGVCVVGGTVLGQYDRTWGWERMHDLNNAGIAFENARSIIDGIRIDNVTDGIRPRPGGQFAIRNAWLTHIRDDCVENDQLQEGVVENSLLDGCYVAFSARPSRSKTGKEFDGSEKVWTIKNSLIRLEPMPGPRGGSADGLGHGSFFKWHSRRHSGKSRSPKLALFENIFMLERAGQSSGGRM